MDENHQNGQVPEQDPENSQNSVDENVQTKIDQLAQDLEHAKKETLYLRAEFDTYKRNAIKERSDLIKFGCERIVVALLEVIDNLDRALLHPPNKDQIDTYIKGVQMTANELKGVLSKFQVAPVESEGKNFDPVLHEALGSEYSDDMEPGKIIKVFKKPYKLHDRVIRPGQVIISKKSDPA